MYIDPDSVIGKEIMYQTALLHEILHEIREGKTLEAPSKRKCRKIRERGDGMECPRCGSKQINGNANFCVKCGAKLRPVCKCWVLKKDNYTCGEDSCPGDRMLVKLAKQKN